MLMLYILLPIFFWTVAVILAGFYPLNRKRMAGIRQELELRRGKI
jgi:Na+/melibiose symporter-like transporter